MHHPPPRAPRALLLAASIVAVATGTKLSVLRSSFLWSGAELSEDRDKATPVCKAAFSKEEDNYCEELLWQCRDDAPRLVDCFKGMRKMFTFEVEKMGTVCADGWGIETSDSQAMFAKCYSWAAEVCRIRDIRQAGKGQVLQTVEKKERCLLTTMMHLTEWRQGMKECRKMGSLSIQSRGWTFWIDNGPQFITAKATRSTKFNAVKFVLLVAGTTLAFTNPAFIGGLVTAVAGKTVLASIPFVVEVLSALALIIHDDRKEERNGVLRGLCMLGGTLLSRIEAGDVEIIEDDDADLQAEVAAENESYSAWAQARDEARGCTK
uniref:Uncharacterized protein n=1 Tax=Chromera velia CCMP2878 TaxID=1169474 RepID=A0A0G4HAM2_9ALVE|eukprot:Cvel_6055.t1-p1 / transcript=Cvel_6055.t1 / gene=Cvel_6055 / organism=Chromera_velia_CCMP2878 / gene_product=hypothetical protein / transcript_product=hypothetical protein / location=Cvel_scaffold291:40327-45701(+) / protein_length=320 / sequence_SO=supercontig / SO=protein_coding / is_pseudo=false